jgi:hypothetical protein
MVSTLKNVWMKREYLKVASDHMSPLAGRKTKCGYEFLYVSVESSPLVGQCASRVGVRLSQRVPVSVVWR